MRIIHLIGALLMLIASPAMAKGAVSAWIVTQKSGDVRVVRDGLQPASVQVRAALSPGDTIATGVNGRAMLTKGDDYVVVSPGSRLTLPKEQKQSGFTRLIQQVGTMLYKVKRTGIPHFAVDTPMLAAVVKGTTFTVVVDDNRAAVQVTEGVVEVSSLTGEARRLVEGGMTVYIGRERPNEIFEVTPNSPRLPGSTDDEAVKISGSGDVSLSTITQLTGGLVREALVTPGATAANVVPAAVNLTPVSGSPAPQASGPPSGPTEAVSNPVVAPATELVEATAPAITQPVVDTVQPVVSPVTAPVVDVVEAVVPPVTAPVVDVVEAVVPPVTAPVVDVVEAVVPSVTSPVVDVVEAVVPSVTAPVVDVVEAVVPPVIEPVVDIVEAIVPPVVEPVVEIVETVAPPVVEPVVDIVEAVVQPVVEPVVDVVETVVQPVVEPVVEIVETVVPPVTAPIVEIVEPVVTPVVAPVVAPVTGLLGGLLGT